MIEILYLSAVKEMSPSLLSAYLSLAVQTSLFIMLTLFPPSILPLFMTSELVMNFTDFLGFFGKKRTAAVVLTKCDNLVDHRTSWGIRYGYSLELSGGLEENIVDRKPSLSFLKIWKEVWKK